MVCPCCESDKHLIRKGSYTRKCGKEKIQRYLCKFCGKGCSEAIESPSYRLQHRELTQICFRLLCCGVSQRRIAKILGVDRKSIARRVVRFGKICEKNLATYRGARESATEVLFDEMESFEHTKCKPLTIPVAVEQTTRKILALGVGSIAAKGPLAKIALAKYGPRRCQRRELLSQLMQDLKQCCSSNALFKTDESRHYPGPIAKAFPSARHVSYKGRKGAVVGQGELKRGGFDPLFYLNHTYAMIRDNVKTLSRRTWCTTKRPDRLRRLLYIYAWFHNIWVDDNRRMPTLRVC